MTCMPFRYRNDFEKTDGASALPRATRFDCCNCTPPKIPPIIPRRAADLTHTSAPGSISHHWLLQYRPWMHNPSCLGNEGGGFSAHIILLNLLILAAHQVGEVSPAATSRDRQRPTTQKGRDGPAIQRARYSSPASTYARLNHWSTQHVASCTWKNMIK